MFCLSESVALIILKIAIIFTNLNRLKRHLKLTQLKRSTDRNSMERFAKKSNFCSIDFNFFFAKRRISVEKMTHRNKGHRTSKIVKFTQSYSNGHFSYYFSLLARARCMTWRVNFVRSKDAQKQLARTSF